MSVPFTNDLLHRLLSMPVSDYKNFVQLVNLLQENASLDQTTFDMALKIVPNMALKGSDETVNESTYVMPHHESDQQAIDYLIENDYEVSQVVIEQFYLQPYPENGESLKKINLKDGEIER